MPPLHRGTGSACRWDIAEACGSRLRGARGLGVRYHPPHRGRLGRWGAQGSVKPSPSAVAVRFCPGPPSIRDRTSRRRGARRVSGDQRSHRVRLGVSPRPEDERSAGSRRCPGDRQGRSRAPRGVSGSTGCRRRPTAGGSRPFHAHRQRAVAAARGGRPVEVARQVHLVHDDAVADLGGQDRRLDVARLHQDLESVARQGAGSRDDQPPRLRLGVGDRDADRVGVSGLDRQLGVGDSVHVASPARSGRSRSSPPRGGVGSGPSGVAGAGPAWRRRPRRGPGGRRRGGRRRGVRRPLPAMTEEGDPVTRERTKWFPNETPDFDVQTSHDPRDNRLGITQSSPSALRGVAVAASAARPRDPGPGTRGGRGTRGRARSRAGGQPLAATRPAPGAAPGQPPAEGQRSRPRALPHAVVSRIVTRVGRTPGTERGDRGGSTAARARRAAGHEEAAVGRASRVPRSTRARPLVAPDARDACPRAVDADTTGPGAAPEVGDQPPGVEGGPPSSVARVRPCRSR